MRKATTNDTDKAFQAIIDMSCEKAKKSEHIVNVLRKCNKEIDNSDLTKVKELLQPLLSGKED